MAAVVGCGVGGPGGEVGVGAAGGTSATHSSRLGEATRGAGYSCPGGGALRVTGIFFAGGTSACCRRWPGGAFLGGGTVAWCAHGDWACCWGCWAGVAGGGFTTRSKNPDPAGAILCRGGILMGRPFRGGTAEAGGGFAFACCWARYGAHGLSVDPQGGSGPAPPPALGGTGPALADFQAPVGGGLAGGAVGAVGAGAAGAAVGRSGTGIWFSLANKAALRQSVSVAT